MILYAIYRHFYIILRQIETKNLQALRRQYLGGKDSIFLDVLFNPMLLSANLDYGNFLIERYLLWQTMSPGQHEIIETSPSNS